MPVNYKNKLIFIHIPKCAGTSIEKMLDMSTPANYFSRTKSRSSVSRVAFSTDEEYEKCAVKNLQHLTFKELKKVMKPEIFNSCTVFSVVRNPYTRLVSEYEYCLKDNSRVGPDFKTDCSTFDTFVQTQLDLSVLDRITKYDGHLETQASYLLNDVEDLSSISKIYRFETIEEAITELKQYTPIKDDVIARQGDYSRNYAEYYSSETTVNKVKEFYAQDFELFNYDPNVIPE